VRRSTALERTHRKSRWFAWRTERLLTVGGCRGR
jgi:hypothetical protein